MELKKLLPGVKTNILLKNHTTFRIGGPARYFFPAKTKKDLIRAVKWAKKNKMPFFLLGGGSNLLVSDKGFPGLAIKAGNKNYKFKNSKLYIEAGAPFRLAVEETIRRGLSGLEWGGGLPGTIGGAIRGNAGAFGKETKDNIIEVECLDKKGNLRKLPKKKCNFSYRSSVFKEKNWIILSARIGLRKGDKKSLELIRKNHIRYRKEKHPLEYPNAGSVFKNVKCRKMLFKKFPELRQFKKREDIPAAFLISQCGLKRKKIGGAKISEKHPNFILNLGRAQAKDVKKLINLIKEKVKKKFNISLEEEIQFLET